MTTGTQLVEHAGLTERDMLELLRAKYTKVRPGTTADRYVRAEHVPHRLYWGDADRIADYLVLDTYSPQTILGFEIKVSRADWLAELRDPTKADAWRQHCHHWYLVVPDPAIVREDLPAGWGLITLNRAGALSVRRRAPRATPVAMPLETLTQLGRAIAKTADRAAAAAQARGAR